MNSQYFLRMIWPEGPRQKRRRWKSPRVPARLQASDMSAPSSPAGAALTRQAILKALGSLSDELGQRGITGELCLFGGTRARLRPALARLGRQRGTRAAPAVVCFAAGGAAGGAVVGEPACFPRPKLICERECAGPGLSADGDGRRGARAARLIGCDWNWRTRLQVGVLALQALRPRPAGGTKGCDPAVPLH